MFLWSWKYCSSRWSHCVSVVPFLVGDGVDDAVLGIHVPLDIGGRDTHSNKSLVEVALAFQPVDSVKFSHFVVCSERGPCLVAAVDWKNWVCIALYSVVLSPGGLQSVLPRTNVQNLEHVYNISTTSLAVSTLSY